MADVGLVILDTMAETDYFAINGTQAQHLQYTAWLMFEWGNADRTVQNY